MTPVRGVFGPTALLARAPRLAPALTLCALAAAPAAAQMQGAPDTTAVAAASTEPFFVERDAWMALGFAVGTVAMAPLDRHLARALQDSTVQAHDMLRSFAETFRFLGFPGSVLIGAGVYGAGRLTGLPTAAEVGLRATEAVLLAYAFVWTGKNVLGRARPDHDPDNPFNFQLARGFRGGSDFQSFPSGHTSSAFAFAAAVSSEIREHWPDVAPFASPPLYAGAALAGASRMFHNRHWASDVVIGAGIGTFSGLKTVLYHHGNPDTALDRWLLPRAVIPTREGYLFVWSVPVGR